jgi:arginine utilization protein RocB
MVSVFFNVPDEKDQSNITESGEDFCQDSSTAKLQIRDEPKIVTTTSSSTLKMQNKDTLKTESATSSSKLPNTDTFTAETATTSSTSKLQKVPYSESPNIVSFFSKKSLETTADNDKHILKVSRINGNIWLL